MSHLERTAVFEQYGIEINVSNLNWEISHYIFKKILTSKHSFFAIKLLSRKYFKTGKFNYF